MFYQKTLANKFLNYSLVGIVCTSIYFLAMFLAVEVFYLTPIVGASLSFIVMTIFSFMLNRKFTFGGVYSHQQLVKFAAVSVIGFILNFIIIYTTVTVLSFHYVIGEVVTILVIPLVNFLLNNYWTFSNR